MKVYILFLFMLSSFITFAQIDGESISYRHYKSEFSATPTNFAVKGKSRQLMADKDILYKYQTGDWHYIYCTPHVLGNLMEDGVVEQIYFNPAQPVLMNDTMRIVQNIDSVHNGNQPLISAFTGNDVIIGYIDTGIDYNHEDFINEDGSTRVLYYWDHSLGYDEERTPDKYGYGQLWSAADIDAGICGSSDGSAHGTTVSGAGSGNGRATGTHKGVAPESDIIIVETNFGLANWTLTVADAVDFIFSMADTLGKPAVVNASVGTYWGSHDGTDPAAAVIDSLLDYLPGRIMVAAAGNSGGQGKYHLKGIVDVDTSFTWFEVNPSSAYGVPATYFDLWADTLDFKDVEFAFGADKIDPDFEFRGRTGFYSIESLLGTTTYDTIWADGNALSPVEFYCEEINGVYHVEMAMLDPDSSAYFFRLETTGSGEFDIWSGAWLGASDIVSEDLPSPIDYVPMVHYMMPDTLSTIVSSWTCSPKVVTVGNFKNQYDYIDSEGETYILGGVPPGELSPNSSKGPNRRGHTKPDVAATGDGIMSACPLWLSESLVVTNPSMLAEGGQHLRNGGTSMASPVVAGIAALYLEKCPTSTYQDFLDALHENAYEDLFTLETPNVAYGYGKVNAFQLLNSTNVQTTLVGDTLICDDPAVFTTEEGPFESYSWFNAETTSDITLDETADVYTMVINEQGCVGLSDTIHVVKGTLPLFPTINIIGGGLITVPADSFIWYYNGVPIDSSNSQYYNPDTTGDFSVQVFSEEGCSYLSDNVYVDQSQILELKKNEFVIFPNPFIDDFHIIKSDFVNVHIVVTDIAGKLVYNYADVAEDDLFISVDMTGAESGIYLLSLFYENNFKSFKLIKQ
ncbi:MAG: S8 family peptidase [Crocinitomix sp.]|nr:S8 family peptidase [Crocinitomix sp.]